MKKTVKKISCAALCAVMLFCMAVPAFALTGYENYSFIHYGYGVRVTCESKLTLLKGRSKLDLSFESGVNHLPVNDYSSIAKVTLKFTDGTSSSNTDQNTGLTATAERDIALNKDVKKSTHEYFVFAEDLNHRVHIKEFE